MKIVATAAALPVATTCTLAQASTWPTRPVTMVVPFPPGGGTDTGARLIAPKLSAKWGRRHDMKSHLLNAGRLALRGTRDLMENLR